MIKSKPYRTRRIFKNDNNGYIKKIGHTQTPLIINFGKDNPVYNLR